jgi:multidrug resistance efflux pump
VDVESGVTSLYPVQPGRVAEVLVKETDRAKAGQVLLRLEDRAARLKVREAQAALRAAEAALALARQLPDQHRFKITLQRGTIEATEHRLAGARALLQQQQRRVDLGQGGQAELTAATEQVKELEVSLRTERAKLDELQRQDPTGEVRRAEAEVAVAQARVDEAQAALDECALKAPRDGEVLRLLAAVGDVLSAQPKQPAVLFCPDAPRLVRAEIDQEFAGAVRQGQEAVIEDDTQPGVTWRGKVLRLSDWYTQRRSTLLDPMQFNDVRTIECLVSLEGGPPPRIGQRVRVRLGGP